MSSDYYSSLTGSSSMTSSNAATSTNCSSNNNNACTSTRWLTEEVFALIDSVQRNEAIYNPRHKYYFCRPYVENFWREVDLKLEKNPGASLAKWTNLRISFRREYTNYLEEKVPPCWTYFDRMFFLHPYLRKKHQQSKSLDSQVQDALVQISSLSSRLQRERAVTSANANSLAHANNAPSPSQPQLDNYLEYFDDPEPNPSDLDDMIDDEHPNPSSHFAHSSLANDIKSECEDNADDFDAVERPVDDDDHDADDAELRNYMFNSLEKRQHQQQQQQHQRLQHLQRLQSKAFYEEFRNKRSRSHENISSSQSYASTPIINPTSSNQSSNVSFVRPTFAKPLEVVSTTTHGNNGTNNNSSNSLPSLSNASQSNDSEAVSNSTARSSSSHHHHHHFSANSSIAHSHLNSRFEISSGLNAQTNLSQMPGNFPPQHTHHSNGKSNTPTVAALPSGATPELCDCKTDPDAMFLMSLLPDIQKLNGRDRGKIKIAFQNILQDYLYPD